MTADHDRVLITGGAGFIGSRLARKLSDQAEVLSFDNLHPQVHGLTPCASELNNVRGDVANFTELENVVRYFKPTIIYHLAAETGTGQSWDEPTRYCQVNVIGTTNLVEAVRKSGKAVRRIVLAGSRAVYGEGGYLDDGKVVCGEPRRSEDMSAGDFAVKSRDGRTLTPVATPEDLAPRPASVYASTKLMQEDLLQQCFDGTDVEVNSLRFQNVYGAGQSLRNPYTGVISIFCEQIMAGKTLNIYEDGNIMRDFVHVSDVVNALAILANQDLQIGTTPVNIGSGKAASILEMALVLLNNFDCDEDRLRISGDFRSGDVRYAVADVERARELLNWSAQMSFEDGLKEVSEWASAGGV